ncbi:MAG: ACT domain-containing protein [Synechocystis sp.]|nr:ACT domain-containing protein [Synechocystis sp.]
MKESISSLEVLLETMKPTLNPGVFVYTVIANDLNIASDHIIALVREPEGLSLIVSEIFAKQNNLPILCRCAWITLTVNSDLEAVGFTAVFSKALGDSGISCNVVAGAHHDHIFVPVQCSAKAMEVLNDLQSVSLLPNHNLGRDKGM